MRKLEANPLESIVTLLDKIRHYKGARHRGLYVPKKYISVFQIIALETLR